MQEKNKVSVIIPLYNSCHTLKRALDSAFSQNMDIEVIIVDDASTDGAEEFMKSYPKKEMIIWLKNKQNYGSAYSRNLGVSMATGEYIAFLDADDWWESGKLELQLNCMQTTGTILTYTGRKIYKDDKVLCNYSPPPMLTYQDLLKCNSIACSSVLMRRSVALEFPMSEEKNIHEDYILWVKILEKYHCIYGLPDILINYNYSKESKSGSKVRSAKMRWNTYRYLGLKWQENLCYSLGYYRNWLAGFRKEDR